MAKNRMSSGVSLLISQLFFSEYPVYSPKHLTSHSGVHAADYPTFISQLLQTREEIKAPFSSLKLEKARDNILNVVWIIRPSFGPIAAAGREVL